MGAFAYAVPLVPDYDVIIICIDLVFPIGWVDSTQFLCAFSETLTDVANALFYTELPMLDYGSIYTPRATYPGPPHTLEIFIHIDCYVDDVIYAVHGGGWEIT